MAFDVNGALQAGASEDDVLSHLSESRKFDVQGALKAGASKRDVIDHMAGMNPKSGFFGRIGENLTGLKDLAVGAVTHPLYTAKSVLMPDTEAALEADREFSKGNYGKAAWGAVKAMPIIGPQIRRTEQDVRNEDYGAIAGDVATAAALSEVPRVVRGVARGAKAIPGAVQRVANSPGVPRIVSGALETGAGVGAAFHGEPVAGASIAARGLVRVGKGLAERRKAAPPKPLVSPADLAEAQAQPGRTADRPPLWDDPKGPEPPEWDWRDKLSATEPNKLPPPEPPAVAEETGPTPLRTLALNRMKRMPPPEPPKPERPAPAWQSLPEEQAPEPPVVVPPPEPPQLPSGRKPGSPRTTATPDPAGAVGSDYVMPAPADAPAGAISEPEGFTSPAQRMPRLNAPPTMPPQAFPQPEAPPPTAPPVKPPPTPPTLDRLKADVPPAEPSSALGAFGVEEPKTISRARIQALANDYGRPESEVRQMMRQEGYLIQDDPFASGKTEMNRRGKVTDVEPMKPETKAPSVKLDAVQSSSTTAGSAPSELAGSSVPASGTPRTLYHNIVQNKAVRFADEAADDIVSNGFKGKETTYLSSKPVDDGQGNFVGVQVDVPSDVDLTPHRLGALDAIEDHGVEVYEVPTELANKFKRTHPTFRDDELVRLGDPVEPEPVEPTATETHQQKMTELGRALGFSEDDPLGIR